MEQMLWNDAIRFAAIRVDAADSSGFDYLQVEVIWQARNEMARTVADVLAREHAVYSLMRKRQQKQLPL